MTYLLPVVLALLLSGCYASLKHSPADDDGSGIRYYRAAPYLLVNTDGRGGLQWRIITLPDQTQKMMAHPVVLGGSSEITLQFRNGILMGSTQVGDTTEVPKAIIAAIQAALPLIAGALEATRPLGKVEQLPAPYLYKIVVAGNDVQFIGGAGNQSIEVTLRPQ